MTPRKTLLKVGIIGLTPGRSWAARSHVPALRALSDLFDIAGVANTNLASAKAAAEVVGIRQAFDDVDALLASSDIDVVAVTVRVPAHFAIVKAAIAAGKHIYCEWPLGNGLAEAEEMARLADLQGVVAAVGTQAIFAPEIACMRRLVANGSIGETLSTTLVGTGGPQQGSGEITSEKTYAYLLDATTGASVLTIPVGHAVSAVRNVLGDVKEARALLATRRTTAQALDTGNLLPVTAPDQVLISGLLDSGAPISLHYRGGEPRDPIGFLWEINGTRADLRLTAPSGHLQMVPLNLGIARHKGGGFEPIDIRPAHEDRNLPQDPEVANVARLYAAMAEDIFTGSRTAPHFGDAVALHRIISQIETSARTSGDS